METNIQTPGDAAGGLLRELHVKVPADRVAQAIDERLRSMAHRAKIPGFRPGKAPFKVIQQQYGPGARVDAVSELVQRTFPEAVMKTGARPAGQPNISIIAEQPGQDLEYTATFEVYPEVQLSGLDTLEIEQPVVEVTEADVDRLIENLRKGRRSLAPAGRAAAPGDVVKVDFDGRLDGETFAGGQGKDVEIELGTGQFLPDLESGIAGHAVDETFEVPVSFPEDYRAEALRGKVAQFSVTVKEVQAVTLPELDDAEFLKAHSVESPDALRAKAREALENERGKAIQRRQKAQVMEQLATRNPLEVPKALVESEIPQLRQQAAGRMNMQNVPPEKLAEMLPAQLFQGAAARKVQLGLLLGEVVKLKQIKLDDARVEAALDSLAADFEQPDQVKAYYLTKPEMMTGLRAMVLEDQVVDALLSEARRTETPMSLEQLLNPKPAA
ncbi:trigger factor [Panacagrimonas sp.]|uniref:trigger factor n=1 Tax=Panacagrimonas sp. TaxID=2480088 RepID=UPI003B51E775